MAGLGDTPILLCEDQRAWERWLAGHFADDNGVWLQLAKKDTGVSSVSYDEALDVALCYGWIDGQKQRMDDQYSLQKFTPRRARSMWSQRNVAKVATLTKAGKMRPSGLAAVEEAKQNGRWDTAYGSSSNLEIPPELQAALDTSPKAQAFFDALNKTNKYAFCWRVHTAIKPETKQARVEKFIGMLEREEKLY
jgi:uncharacterized protein YdeI (YjbR/CyaY-like superfamily)